MFRAKDGKRKMSIPLYISGYRRKMIMKSLIEKYEANKENDSNNSRAKKIARVFQRQIKEQRNKSANSSYSMLVTTKNYLDKKSNSNF